MRDLKFRVWDNDFERYFDEENVLIDKDGTVWISCRGELESEENCIVEQYTGLKDMNGINIYEGDIVKYLDWKPKQIVYLDKSFAGFTLAGTDMFLTTYDCKEMEIIGNIHQHAEILEK